ncbi:MAG: VOC family protein [Pseudomonadota bacterium]|nr:VOC family protein [Pseudomonadota bacterium]
MLDHVSFTVSDVARAKAFYDDALAPLGISAVWSVSAEETGSGAYHGFGSDERPYFWIGGGEAGTGGAHVAFIALDRATVDAFYEAAMAAGGRDNGAPGLRPHYHPDYYGAFVLDPDGHNIEAVCHGRP